MKKIKAKEFQQKVLETDEYFKYLQTIENNKKMEKNNKDGWTKEIKSKKDLKNAVEWCCDALTNEIIIVRQNNVIIQLLFELKNKQ